MSGQQSGPGESSGGGGLDGLFAQMRKQNGNVAAASSSNGAANPSLLQMFGGQRAPMNPYFSQTQSYQARQPQHSYFQASVSSPLPTPPVNNQPPHHASAIMSPVTELPQSRNITPLGGGAIPATQDSRSANLLNLLKFSQPVTSSTPITQHAPISAPRPASLPVRAANPDLLSVFMGSNLLKEAKDNILPDKADKGKGKEPLSHMQSASEGLNPDSTTKAPSADTENFLLQLLNRPKPAQTDSKPHLDPATSARTSSRGTSEDEVRELSKNLGNTSIGKKPAAPVEMGFASSKPAPAQGMFTYVNPFEQLAASSPRNRTPTPAKTAQAGSATPGTASVQILKASRNTAADGNNDLKRKVDDWTPSSSPALSTKRKLPSPGPNPSSPLPSLLPDGRTQVEALMGIGGTGKGKETVSEALSDVGGQVDKQVEEALARVEEDESQAVVEKDMRDLMNSKTEEEFEERAQIAAVDIKKELDKEGNKDLLEEQLPHPVAQAVKDLITKAAKGNVADNWESAEMDDLSKRVGDEALKPVFNFPVRPFQAVTLLADKMDAEYSLSALRDDAVMDVARLKKEFDQIDRTLVTASNDFIVYGMSKNGGIRVIRQQDGKDVKLFTETKDRIFNVSISNSTTDSTETVIGTGISGTVYWAQVKGVDGDYVENESPEKLGFSLPPFKNTGEESSGGVLKTRARKSSNHPEFFAVGRGKSIHIIWPAVVTKQGYLINGPERIVDIEKYLSHRSLKINTGKAGKDFTFSPDDTIIVSLDKAGKVKFWDVRTLTQTDRGTESRYPAPEQIEPIEIKDQLLILNTTRTTEKSWPTSVMFVDRIKAYQKPGPLRYLLVGMKQNHILQFWDLVLGQVVQELHLPHTKESDAVCSVLYHAATGIIIVGHPTRNSIYLIQLSAPRYESYKCASQAEFISRLAVDQKAFGKPSNTCILSSMREFSLEPKGVLRSLEILPSPTSAATSSDDPTLFELYAMHSKGVTCIYVKLEDLGVDKDNKITYPVSLEENNLVSLETIVLEHNTPSTSVVSSPSATRTTPRVLSKNLSSKEHTRKTATPNGHFDGQVTPETPKIAAIRAEVKTESPQSIVSGQESGVPVSPELKKKKKKSAASKTSEVQPAASSSATAHFTETSSLAVSPKALNGATSLFKDATSVAPDPSTSATPALGRHELPQELIDELVEKSGSDVEAYSRVDGLITSAFDTLYQRLENDRRSQITDFNLKQESLLRLVSSTLSDNVQNALSDIISSQFKKSVLPNISQVAAQTVKDQLAPAIASHMKTAMPKELHSALPDALTKTLQKPEAIRLISESVARSMAATVSIRFEQEFSLILQNSVAPAFKSAALQAARDASLDIQRQAMAIIGDMEVQRQADSIKIDQLSRLVTGLAETVSSMATGQETFQAEILKINESLRQQRLSAPRRSEAPESSRSRQVSNAVVRQPSSTGVSAQQQNFDQQLMLDETMRGIRESINVGNYEDAIMRWLQSNLQQEIFDGYFSKIDPNPLIAGCAPLVVLSIGATLTIKLDSVLLERLAFLEIVLQVFHASIEVLDDSTVDVTPRILGLIKQRLETLLMQISHASPQDPLLKRVSNLVSASGMMLTAFNH